MYISTCIKHFFKLSINQPSLFHHEQPGVGRDHLCACCCWRLRGWRPASCVGDGGGSGEVGGQSKPTEKLNSDGDAAADAAAAVSDVIIARQR